VLYATLKTILKGKAIAVTGYEGLYGCEMSKLSHFLDNRLTDGSETISFTHQLPFYRLSQPQAHSVAGTY
jgi:hypothetical protein